MKRPKKPKPWARWTKSDFRPQELQAWIAFDAASREYLSFVGDRRERAGLDEDTCRQISHTLRRKEQARLEQLETLLKARGLNPDEAIGVLDRLQPKSKPEPTP